ncbi:MAG TPA: YciI family protein [Terriglobales bacterium]|jgi:hypothetical protein
MKFMMIVKANKDSEAGKMPSKELLASMGKYNEELMKAGVLVDLAGLHPSSRGFRVKFAQGKRTVIDGPFAETKELIAGFWIINVKSREEAMDWAKRVPDPFGTDEEAFIEVRQFFELTEFEPSAAVDRGRELEAKLEKQKK